MNEMKHFNRIVNKSTRWHTLEYNNLNFMTCSVPILQYDGDSFYFLNFTIFHVIIDGEMRQSISCNFQGFF